MNQFKLNEDELYEKSDVKLVYIGHNMYVELKNIWQPRPQPTPLCPLPPLVSIIPGKKCHLVDMEER